MSNIISSFQTNDFLLDPDVTAHLLEWRSHYNMARTAAALALGFIVMLTPYTLKEAIALWTGSRVKSNKSD